MKHVAIIAPHFVPSNLTSVHRARLLSAHLGEFGWKPTIITVHEKYYEETLEPELNQLLPADLEVRKGWAFGTRPVRLVGDVGLRGFWGMWNEIVRLHREKPVDFVYITVPSFYAALLGPLVHSVLHLPFGIDYIDPWVHQWPGSEHLFSKGWFSSQLARLLEPIAVRDARMITGVAASYYEAVLERHPHLKAQSVQAGMPYGIGEKDFEPIYANSRKPHLFASQTDDYRLVYAGAMLPKGYGLLEIFFRAVQTLKRTDGLLAQKLKIYFIGTGKSPMDPKGYNILPYARKHGLEDCVIEHPHRMPYLDVLNHLHGASGILILGSTDRHYTPSKVFQAMTARKPIFAVLHEASSAVQVIRNSRSGEAVTFPEGVLPEPDQLRVAVARFMKETPAWKPCSDLAKWTAAYSARESARILAETLEQAVRGQS